MFIKSITWS